VTGKQDLLTAAFEAERMKAEADSDDQANDLLQDWIRQPVSALLGSQKA
jgi:hypothetical protein